MGKNANKLGVTLKTVSSAQTFLMKIVFPVVWITGFGAGTLGLWLGGMHTKTGALPPPAMKWQFLAAWAAGTIFILWGCAGLKRVRVDSTNLLVSDYRHEITVPLSNIERVTENRLINIHPVTIHFRVPTEFGSRITFMPTMRIFGLWSSHPIVSELTGLSRTGGR